MCESSILTSCIISFGGKIFNALTDTEQLAEWQQQMEDLIDSSSLANLFALVDKGSRLVFLKYCEEYLSQKDLGESLEFVWISSLDPNQDPNCSIDYLIDLFKKCDKKFLMNAADYRVYEEFPDELQVYRGVGVGRNPKGLSWTRSLDEAVWFSNRFNKQEKHGYVQTAIVKKEDVLAYFNNRGEEEVVCDVNKLTITVL